jgi:hypothetical protein
MKGLTFGVVAWIALLTFAAPPVLAQGRLARDPLADYPASNELGVIIVGPKTMNFLRRFGSDAVFFTSKDHPLTRLADITNADVEFGAWGIGLFQLDDLMNLKYMIGGQPKNLRMIGNGNFSKLFYQNPKLKLFVTSRTVQQVETIERSGGGMKVRFQLVGGATSE